MTTARSEIYDEQESNWYHCISRCVRRAFLCGEDPYTGRSFEYRKAWIKNRLSELLEIFAIDCLAYAIMCSHLHTILSNHPEIAARWRDTEVAIRWRKLFPRRRTIEGKPEEPTLIEIEEITNQPELVAEYRKRLSNISWFQRCLNQEMACKANAEDDCNGRFWQGRFKCIRLEDEAALLACSVYVDLNPIRADIAKTPETSNWTSVQDRILSHSHSRQDSPRLIAHKDVVSGIIDEKEYLQLVDETGRIVKSGKGCISSNLQPILDRLKISETGLILNAKSQSKIFHLVIGRYQSLKKFALKSGKKWIHGYSVSRQVFL